MKNSSIKLQDIITGHTVFEPDQVLTHEQLNEIVTYLDQQSRQTRRSLHGYGVVWGLNLHYNDSQVTLGKGFGLTTDGDLLEIGEDTTYSDFRVFEDENAKYPLFEDVTVYELLDDSAPKPKEANSLRAFKRMTRHPLQDFAAMLYLESYVFDPDLCTGDDCDNKGQRQINNLRVILIAKEVLQKRGMPFSPAKKYFSLGKVSIGRLKMAGQGIDTFGKLSAAYLNIVNKTAKELSDATGKAYQSLAPALSTHLNQKDPTKAWADRLKEILKSAREKPVQVQYVYDFLRELVQAYHEFTDAVFQWETEGLPDIRLAPKHILLGDAMGLTNDRQDEFRQGFVKSPAYPSQAELVPRILFLFARIGRMIEAFNPSGAREIRITPGRLRAVPLGKKSIPFYYAIKGETTFNKAWDYDLTARARENGIYSYNAAEYQGSEEALDPLSYDLADFDHFRIEGHLGQPFENALNQLEDIIVKNNLPLKVVPIQIEKERKTVWVRPGYRFYGMEIMHKLYRDELIHHLNELKKFSTDLDNKVQLEDDSKLPPVQVETNTVSVKTFTRQQTRALNKKIDDTKTFLARSIVDFEPDSFEQNFKAVVDQGSLLNRGIKNVTVASTFTPLEKIINNVSFSKLKGIQDLIGKRLDRVREKSILEKFAEENPGLEHLAGAPAGGTFVLLYSSADKTVVADMCLPYWYTEPPVQEVPEESDTSDDKVITDWKFNNDFLVHISPAFELKNKLDALDLKVSTVKNTVDLQATNLLTYQGSINTLATILPTYKWEGLKATDLLLGATGVEKEVDAMRGIASYRDLIEEKKARGTATAADDAILKDMEKVMGSVAAKTIEKISSAEGDVLPGSAEEKVLEMALDNASRISGEAQKNKVKETIRNVKSGAGSKANMIKLMNRFNL